LSFLLDDRTARCMIGYWHDNVVFLSLSVCLWCCALWLNDVIVILQQKCTNNWKGSPPGNTILQLLISDTHSKSHPQNIEFLLIMWPFSLLLRT